ncbi:MAG: oxidoreductase C-terminal domain-containing protein [Alteraurantiacibacter sp.]
MPRRRWPLPRHRAKAWAARRSCVEVDAFCRTTLPHVYAIGDCAAHASRFAGGKVIRLESVQNANDMAKIAAAAICGNEQPYQATPWFWSTQYDLKLQAVGLCHGHDEVVVRGGSRPAEFLGGLSKTRKDCRVRLCERRQGLRTGEKPVEARATVPTEELARADLTLKELASALSI